MPGHLTGFHVLSSCRYSSLCYVNSIIQQHNSGKTRTRSVSVIAAGVFSEPFLSQKPVRWRWDCLERRLSILQFAVDVNRREH